MPIRRVVTDLTVADASELAAATAFYVDVLEMVVAMDHGWIVTLVDPARPQSQLSLMTHDATAPVPPAVSVEVADVDALDRAYAAALARGDEIVHPLTDEKWGVRRFFARDPSGAVVNILTHL